MKKVKAGDRYQSEITGKIFIIISCEGEGETAVYTSVVTDNARCLSGYIFKFSGCELVNMRFVGGAANRIPEKDCKK